MKNATILATAWYHCTSGSGRVYDSRFSCMSFLLCFILLFGGLLLVYSPAQAEIKAGDILVVDGINGTNGLGALFLVNPMTGQRTVLSDFGNPAQGPLGFSPISVALGAGGQIFVNDLFGGGSGFEGALFEVDPNTGNRALVSDFGQGDIQGNLNGGLAVDDKGRVIANLQQGFGLPFPTGIVRVTPKSDTRVLISDLSNPAQGETLFFPNSFVTDLTKERSGEILITTFFPALTIPVRNQRSFGSIRQQECANF